MTTTEESGIRPLEPVALRAFKALLVATGSVGILSALGFGAAHVAKVDVQPLVVVGVAYAVAVNLGFEAMKAIAVGRPRLGLQDKLARRLASEAYAVARQEPGGAWVVLRGQSSVEVMGTNEFEAKLAQSIAMRDGDVFKVVRPELDGFRVERWQGGVIRNADQPGPGCHAIERFDRKGRLVGVEDVRVGMPEFPVWGADVHAVEGQALEFVPRKSPSEREREAREAEDGVTSSLPGGP